jgi:hypothetical protein
MVCQYTNSIIAVASFFGVSIFCEAFFMPSNPGVPGPRGQEKRVVFDVRVRFRRLVSLLNCRLNNSLLSAVVC